MKYWYRQLNVDSSFVSCKHICCDASLMEAIEDKSFSEFGILSFKNKCYYGCNVCLKIVTFMDMVANCAIESLSLKTDCPKL